MRVKLAYVEQGDPWGIPVVLLHGWSDSWKSFEPVLPYLPESVHAFALSQRGHGDSGRPSEGYAAADFAGDVAEFMEVLGLRRAVIVGHSMGAAVAQQFAVDYPDKTLGLMLVGSFESMKGNAAFEDLWTSTVSQLTDPVDPAFVSDFQRSTLARPIADAFFQTVVDESLKLPARVWRASGQGLVEWNLSASRARIVAPTRLIWGDRDSFVPRRDQDALAAAIRGAQLIVYSGTGHAVHWEEPQRFAEDLVAFTLHCSHEVKHEPLSRQSPAA
jgi:pimeloyl-ACP methyl ester carboxylesterase